jgi:hypothetical protein
MQKGGISVPREMQRGHFQKSSLRRNIAAFQLVGYSAWNGEAAGSSPACYTKLICSSNREGRKIFNLEIRVQSPYGLQPVRWCNG